MLFDLEADPQEERDLSDHYPERVRKMSAELTAWFEQVEHERAAISPLDGLHHLDER